MNVYNVALGVAGTWHKVTIPQGISNFSINSRGNNDITVRRLGQTNYITVDASGGPYMVLNRHLREPTVLEISCPGAADEVAEVGVWS